MNDGQELNSASFNDNYRILKETADWLSTQEEPDIDRLVPEVERAMRAYRICKERLSAVQATLGQYLQGDGTAASDGKASADGATRVGARPSPDGDGEDVPF